MKVRESHDEKVNCSHGFQLWVKFVNHKTLILTRRRKMKEPNNILKLKSEIGIVSENHLLLLNLITYYEDPTKWDYCRIFVLEKVKQKLKVNNQKPGMEHEMVYLYEFFCNCMFYV